MDVFKECDKCPEMVVMPAGRFTMGSPDNEPERERYEGPQHTVTIAKPFAVGRSQVTRDQFQAFVTETGYDAGSKCRSLYEAEERSGQSWRNPGFVQDVSHPAVCLIWDDAKAYTVWLSRKTGKTYRLLSEAEREYVTRAGTSTPFWWGPTINPSQANYDGNYRRGTVPVDWFQPNPWGLYQVHGNVWEWTEDCWHPNYTGAPPDGTAWTTGDCRRRISRGGHWGGPPRYLRATLRGSGTSDERVNVYGFRVASTLNP